MKPLYAVLAGIAAFASALVIFVPTPADAGGLACAKRAEISNAPKGYEDVKQMIFFAVMEGLYRDGVSTETAELLIGKSEKAKGRRYFVYACPLCMPAENAIRTYAVRADFRTKDHRDTFGDGLPEATRDLLASEEPMVRVNALQELILKWVQTYQERRRLTPEEAAEWRIHLDGMREKGNAMLENYLKMGGKSAREYEGWEKCPACEGSNGAMNPR